MNCVIDSSVAFKWVVVETHSDKAIHLRDDFRNKLHTFMAPDVFPVELGHALTRSERQKRLTPPAGWALWLNVMADAPALYASLPLMPRAYAISSAHRIGIYDCLYLALAEREKCDFITADDKLIRNLQPTFPFIVSLSSLP